VRLPVSGTTVDLAHRAVRLALQLARELPGWSFALTTGFFPVVSGGDSDAGDEAALCDHLTRAAVCFPGTRLRVRYSVDGVPSSA
jgi:hypothetical protein